MPGSGAYPEPVRDFHDPLCGGRADHWRRHHAHFLLGAPLHTLRQLAVDGPGMYNVYHHQFERTLRPFSINKGKNTQKYKNNSQIFTG